jgi:WD40 repeat protein
MSNWGQAALTIIGFAVGSFFGYPQLGFVLGSLAGQAIFPTQLPGISGPRLSDTRSTTGSIGAPVMEVFGIDAVPGTVMFLSEVREQSETEEAGGKGGGEQKVTTYTYFQDIAIGLCRGPQDGVRRIWENGKLVYDARPQQDDEDDEAYEARASATWDYSQTFVLYLGTETQLPDPTIEAIKGVGSTPAFRGLMYIVYPNRQLQQDQGLRHPNFKFEIAEGVLVDVGDEEEPDGDLSGQTWALAVAHTATDTHNGPFVHLYGLSPGGSPEVLAWTPLFSGAPVREQMGVDFTRELVPEPLMATSGAGNTGPDIPKGQFIWLFEWETWAVLPDPDTTYMPEGGVGADIRFSPDGRYMAQAHHDVPFLVVHEYDTELGWVAIDLGAHAPVRIKWCIDFTPDSEICVVAGLGGIGTGGQFVDIYDTDTWQRAMLLDVDTPGNTFSCSCSPSGNLVALAHDGFPYLSIYEMDRLNGVAELQSLISDGIPNDGYAVKFSPDGLYLAVGHDNAPYLTIYNTNTWEKLSGTPTANGRVRSIDWSPDSRFLAAVGNGSPYIAVYDRLNGWAPLETPSPIPTGFAWRCRWVPWNLQEV